MAVRRKPPPYQSIADDVKLGRDVRIFNFVNLYGCEIGDNTKIGTFVEVQKNAKIGKNCFNRRDAEDAEKHWRGITCLQDG
jgi:UDP-3-O-[3-hydroxymyristoyl] glucosamine N-acyltransferase